MAKSIGKTVAAVVILSSVALSCAATAISVGALTRNEIDWGEGQSSSVPESAAQARSIVSIEKSETLGLVDKYTITYSDGTTSIFLVTNGKDGEPGIQGLPGPDGRVPAITVGANGNWFVDGVDQNIRAEGLQGPKGDPGRGILSIEKTNTYGLIDEYTITYTDNTTSVFLVTNGQDGQQGIQGMQGPSGHTPVIEIGTNGNWFIDSVDSGVSATGLPGTAGKSAYELAVDNGYTGTLEEWLLSLVGAAGAVGQNGKSAYEVAVHNGYTGTEVEWLTTLIGADGMSAYQIYCENHLDPDLSEEQWVASLYGEDGQNGKSAYEIYVTVNPGSTLSESEWLESLVGQNGQDGRGIASITGPETSGLFDTYTINYSDSTTSTFVVRNGADGANGASLLTGSDDPDATDGESGDSYINTTTWEYFTKSGNAWASKGSIRGADGSTGATGAAGVDGRSLYTGDGVPAIPGNGGDSYIDLTTGDYYVHSGTEWVFRVNVRGDDGEDGRGIATISLTSSTDEDDTYTISYTDGSSTNFQVAKPRSIVSIAKTSTDDLVDTYTITYSYGSTSTFTVTNGADGLNGQNGKTVLHGEGAPDNAIGTQGDVYIDTANLSMYFKGMAEWGDAISFKGTDGANGSDGVGISAIEKTDTTGLVDTYTITYTNSTTSTFTVKNGADGKDGTRVVTGNTAPSSTSGFQEGDSYIDTTTWNYYVLTMNAGDQLEWQLSGNIKGAAGHDGTDGNNGTDGASLLTGTSNPTSSVGKSGDSYINTSTWEYFTRSGSTWTSKGTIRGTNGTDGNNGTDGSSLLTGTSNPTSSVGKSGDSYVNTTTWEYFTRSGDAWTSHGTIKGSNGTDGTNGKDGTKVVTGDTTPSSTSGFQEGDSYINTSNWNFYVLTAGAGNTLTWTYKGNIHASPKNYTVTFNSNGGNEVASITNAVEGCTITKPTNPTKSGYFFQGWYTVSGDKWGFDKDVVTKNITLYASWGQLKVENGVLTGCTLTGDVEIPYVYEGQVITSIASNTFLNVDDLTKIVLPSTITEIPNMAFYNCDYLAEVVLPETIKTIADQAFQGCQRLKKINLPDSIESIGEMAFRGSKIEALVLPKGLTSLGDSAFYSTSLKYIASPEGMSLTTIPTSAFSYCTNLEEVVLPDSVTTIGDYCFRGDNKLKRLVTPTASFGTDHNQSLGQLFDNQASGLKEIIVTGDGAIPEDAFKDTSPLSLTFTGNPSSFARGCLSGLSSLTSLSLPYLGGAANDYANTGFLSYLFDGYDPVADAFLVPSSLTSVEIRGGKIGMNAFTNCEYLKSIIIGKGITGFDYDTTDDSACQPLLGCSSLERLEVPYVGVTTSVTGNKAWLKYLFGEGANAADAANSLPATLETVVVTTGFDLKGGALRKCINIKNVVIASKQIGDYAFEGSGIESLVLPDYVDYLGYHACENCPNLVYVKLPENNDFRMVRESAFAYTPKLRTVIMPSNVYQLGTECFAHSGIQYIDLSNITEFSSGCFAYSKIRSVEFSDQLESISEQAVFSNCEQLERVVIPHSVNYIAHHAFEKCHGLSSLVFDSLDDATNDLEIGNNAFEECYLLSTVILPERTTELNNQAFRNCKGLAYVRLPAKLESVGAHCFEGCSSLIFVENCASNLEIYGYAFSGCVQLKYFTTYDSNYTSTASISSISLYAFEHCSSLETIDLNGLTVIELAAFAYSGLKEIVLPDTITSMGNSIFFGCESLRSVTFTSNSNITEIPSYFCNKCSSLKEVVFYSNVTKIGYEAFKYSGLSSIVIPDTVTEIDNGAFAYCYELKNITLPDTGDLKLGSNAFTYCTALETIRISAAVKSIGTSCFEKCYSLKTVTFLRGSDLHVSNYAFYYTAITTVNTVLSESNYSSWHSFYVSVAGNEKLNPSTTATTFNYNYIEP